MPVAYHAFTNTASGRAVELLSDVGIGCPLRSNSSNIAPEIEGLTGVWDTGATGCSITKEAAQSIGVYPVSQTMIGGVHGVQSCNVYLVSLYLPNGICVPNIEMSEMSSDAGCDVLIGMNVIGIGDFVVTTLEGKTSFSFRMPSCQRIDFATHFPKDTSVCTCGSGSMYKNCCKKKIVPVSSI